jgi:Tol biopolymer transport system component
MRPIATRIATAVAVAALALPAAAGATFPGRNGRIFFSAPSRGEVATGCDTASVRPDGSAYNCVDYFRRDAAVSPDQRHIVAVEGDTSTDVFGMNIDGTGVRRFTHASGETQNLSPTWTPDSRHVIYTVFQSSADGVYEMNPDGSGQHLMFTPGQDAVISSSGAQVAYDGDGIRVADANGGGSRLLVPNHNDTTVNGLTVRRYVEFNQEPNWSPNGRQIVFSRETHLAVTTCTVAPPSCQRPQRQDAIDVYVMNADGSGLRQLTSTTGFDEEDPHFSPDGSQIAYFKQDAQLDVAHGQIWVMRADGGGQHQVANGANPDWTSVQSGPSKPRLKVTFRKLNRRSKCLGTLDGYVISVRTNASRKTQFDVSDYVDGKLIDKEFNSRGFGGGVDTLQLRRGRHHLRVVVEDAAVRDRISRTFAFRRC